MPGACLLVVGYLTYLSISAPVHQGWFFGAFSTTGFLVWVVLPALLYFFVRIRVAVSQGVKTGVIGTHPGRRRPGAVLV
jgi:hypothetical protein